MFIIVTFFLYSKQGSPTYLALQAATVEPPGLDVAVKLCLVAKTGNMEQGAQIAKRRSGHQAIVTAPPEVTDILIRIPAHEAQVLSQVLHGLEAIGIDVRVRRKDP